jgi:precorrin-3B synthase
MVSRTSWISCAWRREGRVFGPPPVILGLDPRICFSTYRVNAAIAGPARDARVKPEPDGRGTGRDGTATRHDGGAWAHAGTPPIFVGAGLPFGGIGAEELAALASTAAASGASELRLTPWRAILVPVASVEAARALMVGLAPHSLIFESSDPRRHVAACPGAPSCSHATTPVRDDAARLAARLGDAPGLETFIHVSGCEKGCAHPGRATVTLVGRDGRYDIVLAGLASSRPVQRNLTSDQIVELVPRIAASHAQVPTE